MAALASAFAILVLAVVEAGAALVSPRLSPSDEDWMAAAAFVNGKFAPDDLIVAAPEWADPVLRQHLGDRLPGPIAGRLDHERFARIWEISQRGGEAPEADGARLVQEQRFGNLRVRLFERAAKAVTYDFTNRWREARVTREAAGQPPVPCELQPTQHQCPDFRYNFVRDALLEIGGGIRHALYAQPVSNAAVVLEYPSAVLGRELAVAGGLHNVWLRKVSDGTVTTRVLVDDKEIGRFDSGNRTGWTIRRFDTAAFAGKTARVRFEITSANPYSRHFGLAAEARGR
ncbi:MAG TPA: hypothetical protein VGG33_17305 [Polyangia bacterium]